METPAAFADVAIVPGGAAGFVLGTFLAAVALSCAFAFGAMRYVRWQAKRRQTSDIAIPKPPLE